MTRQTLNLVLGVLLVISLANVLVDLFDEQRSTAASTAPATSAIASPPAAPVVREILNRALPPAAPGQQLELVRYTIAPGSVLAVHVHPGVQLAWIESGELTYHVLKGEVPVTRQVGQAGGDRAEAIVAGETTVVLPGDAIVEATGVVHYGENLGAEPVVIWAATLLTKGQPAAIPVNSEGTPVG